MQHRLERACHVVHVPIQPRDGRRGEAGGTGSACAVSRRVWLESLGIRGFRQGTQERTYRKLRRLCPVP
jgi:hypothetical protein